MNAAQSAPAPQPPPLFPPKVAVKAEIAKQMRYVTRAQALVAKAVADGDDGSLAWPPVLREELGKLTHKQRQFAVRYAGGQSLADAYRASYDVSEDRPDEGILSDSYQVRANPKVSVCVDMLNSYLSHAWLADAVEVKEHAASVLYEQTIWGDTSSARIKAAETLLRMHGLLIDKKEITHRDANEMDEQAQLFRSILADVNLSPVIEAEYTQLNQQVTGPSIGYVCSACNSRAKVHEAFEGGDGI